MNQAKHEQKGIMVNDSELLDAAARSGSISDASINAARLATIQALAAQGAVMGRAQAGQGNGIPQQDLAANKGYALHNPGELQMDTPRPLPFDEQFARVKFLNGVRNYLPLGMFDQQEAMHAQLERMTPELARSFKYENSIYAGVPDNAVLNRMNIFRQRDRENRLYAFV